MENNFKVAKLYKGEVEVKFSESNHRYYINGQPARISVSGITGVIDKSGPLIPWAVKKTIGLVKEQLVVGQPVTEVLLAGILSLASSEHVRIKDEAADEGTQVHAKLEEWIRGGLQAQNGKYLITSGDVEILHGLLADKPEALHLSIEQFGKWLVDNKVIFLDAEKIVYSRKYKYPGMIDALMLVKGLPMIGDYKIKGGVYDETKLQTAAYQGAESEESGVKYKGRRVFRIGRKDGVFTGDFEVIKYQDFRADFKAFLNAMKLKRWLMDQRIH